MIANAKRTQSLPSMPRIVVTLLGLSLAFSFLFARAYIAIAGLPDRSVETNSVASVVGLRNGSTLFIPEGTVAREIADWLNSNRAGTRIFDVGGHQFVGTSDRLTGETRERLQRLAFMLRANRDVTLTVLAPSNASGSRASKVVEALAADGVPAEMLGIETLNASRAGGKLSIVITRSGQTSPEKGA